jgi:hypothetical protein
MGVQKHNKKRLTKKSSRKLFTKKSTKNPKPIFSRFSFFFYHVFGRFSVRGVQKHDKKISKKNLTSPGTFLASEEPTNHVGVRHFFFECPLRPAGATQQPAGIYSPSGH